MPKITRFNKSRDKAHSHLLRGFDKALDHFHKVPLGHNVLDARTMENRFGTNIAGMTGGLPMDSRRVFQKGSKKEPLLKGEQSLKNKLAGIVVDPTAIETAQGQDQVSIDTAGGYGIVPSVSEGGG